MRLFSAFRQRKSVAEGKSRAAAADTVLSPPSDETPRLGVSAAERVLGDFSISSDVWPVLVLSVVAGAVSAGVALGLLDLIGLKARQRQLAEERHRERVLKIRRAAGALAGSPDEGQQETATPPAAGGEPG